MATILSCGMSTVLPFFTFLEAAWPAQCCMPSMLSPAQLWGMVPESAGLPGERMHDHLTFAVNARVLLFASTCLRTAPQSQRKSLS